MCINFAWLRWLPMNQASPWPPMLFWFFWTDENANLGTAMRYEEIGETMWFSLPWFLVFKSVLACHFESSSENTEFAQGEKKLTAYFSSGKYKQHQIRQRQPNSCLRNRRNSRNLSISHVMVCLYCEEGICVLYSASFFLMGKMWLVSSSSYQSCCVYPHSGGKTSHYCVLCVLWCDV